MRRGTKRDLPVHPLHYTRDLEVEGVGMVPSIDMPLWWQRQGLSFAASGYGPRIPTRRMVWLEGRWRRVYVCIWSNSGTAYIGRSIRQGRVVAD